MWISVAQHFVGSETISIETAAKARRERVKAARWADGPAFAMSAADQRASVIETCLYLRVFGEGTEGRARREWVRVLFGMCFHAGCGRGDVCADRRRLLAEQERLPFDEGFRRSETVITIPDILVLEEQVNAAS